MPKRAEKLTVTQVNAIIKNKMIELNKRHDQLKKSGGEIKASYIKYMFPVGGVAGLNIQVKLPDSVSWILRTYINGTRKAIGMGGYPEVSLKNAREDSEELKRKIRLDGIDPIENRRAKRVEAKKEKARAIMFVDLANEYVDKRSQEFKTAQQTRKLKGLMTNYILPAIGNMRVTDIDLNDIKAMLDPIWYVKTETASRVRTYTSHVFDLAIARGIYTQLNPARWAGGLKTLLPAQNKISEIKHRESLPVETMPELWVNITTANGVATKCLQFGILTGARYAEMAGVKWSEIDFKEKVWRIPANRMKGAKPRPHDVPLCDEALAVLSSMPREYEIIFPNTKGAALSDTAISKVHKKFNYGVTTHGFRSTFKHWASQPKKFKHTASDDDLS